MNKKIVLLAAFCVIVVGGWFAARKEKIEISAPLNQSSDISAEISLSPLRPVTQSQTNLTFTFTNPDDRPITDLMTHHDRRVHVLIASEDLTNIGHIHPQDFREITDEMIQSGTYTATYPFEKAGKYIVGIDAMTATDKLSKHFIVDVDGGERMGEIKKDMRLEKCFQGYAQSGLDRYIQPVNISQAEVDCSQNYLSAYKITLTPSAEKIKVGEEVRLTYNFVKADTPLTDLEPYLDAPIHFAIVPEDLSALMHRHGEAGDVPAAFGPDLVSESVVFPSPGLYQVFSQAKHKGHIIFANFMVEVH